MSLLDTVELQGIRSVGVGPENASVIEFLSPLTIICGPNGAGKTTIIEALKYATTGELPKGSFQTFIHDIRVGLLHLRLQACIFSFFLRQYIRFKCGA